MLLGLALLVPACRNGAALPPAGPIAILTALPLFGADADPATILNGPDRRTAIVRALAQRHELIPIARIEEGALGRAVLVLAQPHALAGEELVALDKWVRGGGRALIFTDPELVWPVDLPLGDPRRAPPVSLLDPLLAHWGLTLLPALPDAGVGQIVSVNGSDLAVARAGHWQASTRDCAIEADGLIADCRIGKGRALLVADADLLDERLWLLSGAENESVILGLVSRVAGSGKD